MLLNSLNGIFLHKHRLQILTERECEQLDDDFLNGRAIYLCVQMMTPSLLKKRDIRYKMNSACRKKLAMLSHIGAAARMYSFDDSLDYTLFAYYPAFWEEKIFHLPIFALGRLTKTFWGQLQVLVTLLRLRKSFETIVFYNASYYFVLPLLIMKYLFHKKIIIDFEDDYSVRDDRYLNSIAQKVIVSHLDGAILVNTHLKAQIPIVVSTKVVNGFFDLSYLAALERKEYSEFRFIFSSSLDDLRGADLLEHFVLALKNEGFNFSLTITGYGPESDTIATLAGLHSNVAFEGFVSSERLSVLMDDANVGLVLQPRGSEFGRGSYPSKIQEYAEHKLPVLWFSES